MQIGMVLPQGGPEATRAGVMRIAREAEASGLDSLWVLDRLLRPTRAISRAPGAPEEELPEAYGSVLDPLETLSFVAACTERVQLGTSVVLALFQPPVMLAKRLATLDLLSEGRVIAGLAQGWMGDEFLVADVPEARRGAGFAEYVAALRAVWSPNPVRHDGRFYQIPEADIGPKPARPGGIPVLIGGYAPAAISRAGRIGDGFNPYVEGWDQLSVQLTIFTDAARAAGRDPGTLSIVERADAQLTDAPLPEPERPRFRGSVEQWAEDVVRTWDLGIGHIFFSVDAPGDIALNALVKLRRLVGSCRPRGPVGATAAPAIPLPQRLL